MSPRQKLILDLLRDAGRHGVLTADFLEAGAGSRFGARIYELRQQGYVIEESTVRRGSAKYVLIFDAERGSSANPGSLSSEPAAVSLGADRVPRGTPALAVGQLAHADGQGALFRVDPTEGTEHWRAA